MVSVYDVSTAAGSRQMCLWLDKLVIRLILSVRISFLSISPFTDMETPLLDTHLQEDFLFSIIRYLVKSVIGWFAG